MNLSPVIVKKMTFWTTAGHVKVTFPLLLERISKQYECFECRVLSKVDQINSFILNIWSKSTNVTFTWPAGVQSVILCVTITGDKFVIYVPLRRYPTGKSLVILGNMTYNTGEYGFCLCLRF